MAFEDIAAKIGGLIKGNGVAEALKSEQAEVISDKALDAAAGAVNQATGAKFEAQIENVREVADKQVGTE